MFKNFLRLEIRSFVNIVKFVSWPDSFKSSFLLIVGFIFLWLLYQGFFRILVYLNTVEFIGGLLIIKLFAMIMLTFFVMLIFSNMIISFSTVYFSNDLDFLISMPLSVKNIFIYKFIKTTFFSSWMVLLVFLPFLFAYGRIKFTGAGFYASVLLLLIPFFLIASSIGTLTSTVFMRLFPSQKMRDIFIILGVVAVGAAYLFARFIQPEDFLKADKLDEVVQYISVIQMPTAKYLPSWWFTSAIFLYASKQWSNFFAFSSLLIVVSIITAIIVIYISDKLYYELLASSRESTGYKFLSKLDIKGKPCVIGARSEIQKTSFLISLARLIIKSRGIFSVFVKDVKIFFRDTGQWSQLLLLLALVVVYLFNIYKLPLDTFFLKSLISFLNIGLAGFVLAAVSLRFIYPLVSLEGKSFWLIKAAPVTVKNFLWEKFFMAVIPLVFFGGLLVGISNYLLNVEKFLWFLSLLTILSISITLTAMAVGFGALFPKFKVENISQIESSIGGMIYMIFSMFYVFLTISLLAIPMRLWFLSRFYNKNVMHPGIIATVIISLIAINSVAVFLSMYLGKKNLEVLDV
ncbi:MAG: hypothetical protein HY919_01070 [Elusimicrobia bacterium]|nr:hypothetical protein [Elusimicrobiota bacterium]